MTDMNNLLNKLKERKQYLFAEIDTVKDEELRLHYEGRYLEICNTIEDIEKAMDLYIENID